MSSSVSILYISFKPSGSSSNLAAYSLRQGSWRNNLKLKMLKRFFSTTKIMIVIQISTLTTYLGLKMNFVLSQFVYVLLPQIKKYYQRVRIMDPTKPILSLNQNFNGCFYRDVTTTKTTKQTVRVDIQQRCVKLQQEKNFFKQQYQKLYKEFTEREARLREYEQLKLYVTELEQRRGGGPETKQLIEKNEQLSELLLKKNYELEEAYRKIQMQEAGGSDGGAARRILAKVDRLEDGVKEAIHSNFELLKNNSINEIRTLIRSGNQQPVRVQTKTTTTRQIHRM